MTLTHPVIITARLLPGVHIGNGFVSIKFAGYTNGRMCYRYYIDIDDNAHSAADLTLGMGGATLQLALGTLLAFLEAAGEGYQYERRPGCESENTDMFPDWVNEWAYRNSDELSMLRLELEESGQQFIEE